MALRSLSAKPRQKDNSNTKSSRKSESVGKRKVSKEVNYREESGESSSSVEYPREGKHTDDESEGRVSISGNRTPIFLQQQELFPAFMTASSTSIDLVSTVNSTATTLVTGVATAAAATWVDLGLYFNGTDLLVYANSQIVARVSAPTIGSTGTTLTNALLGPVFQITPVATDTLSADFVLAAQEVLR